MRLIFNEVLHTVTTRNLLQMFFFFYSWQESPVRLLKRLPTIFRVLRAVSPQPGGGPSEQLRDGYADTEWELAERREQAGASKQQQAGE